MTKGEFPILRVFASWEGDAKLDRSMEKTCKKNPTSNEDKKKKVQCDVDPHPLVTLHLDNFNCVSKEMDINWFSGDVEQKEVVNVKQSACSVGLDVNTQRPKWARQQEIEGDGMV